MLARGSAGEGLGWEPPGPASENKGPAAAELTPAKFQEFQATAGGGRVAGMDAAPLTPSAGHGGWKPGAAPRLPPCPQQRRVPHPTGGSRGDGLRAGGVGRPRALDYEALMIKPCFKAYFTGISLVIIRAQS